MHGPEKGHYVNEVEFVKINRPDFILWKRHSKPHFWVAAQFEKITTNETIVTFRQIFDSIEECEKIRPHVTDKNEENFDRLVAELEKMK